MSVARCCCAPVVEPDPCATPLRDCGTTTEALPNCIQLQTNGRWDFTTVGLGYQDGVWKGGILAKKVGDDFLSEEWGWPEFAELSAAFQDGVAFDLYFELRFTGTETSLTVGYYRVGMPTGRMGAGSGTTQIPEWIVSSTDLLCTGGSLQILWINGSDPKELPSPAFDGFTIVVPVPGSGDDAVPAKCKAPPPLCEIVTTGAFTSIGAFSDTLLNNNTDDPSWRRREIQPHHTGINDGVPADGLVGEPWFIDQHDDNGNFIVDLFGIERPVVYDITATYTVGLNAVVIQSPVEEFGVSRLDGFQNPYFFFSVFGSPVARIYPRVGSFQVPGNPITVLWDVTAGPALPSGTIPDTVNNCDSIVPLGGIGGHGGFLGPPRRVMCNGTHAIEATLSYSHSDVVNQIPRDHWNVDTRYNGILADSFQIIVSYPPTCGISFVYISTATVPIAVNNFFVTVSGAAAPTRTSSCFIGPPPAPGP